MRLPYHLLTAALPDAFAAILKRCAASRTAMEGKKLHAHMVVAALGGDPFVENHLINMYSKCGFLDDALWVFRLMGRKNLYSWNTIIDSYCKFGFLSDARKLFDEMPVRDSVSWNTMISGYDRCGPFESALEVFVQMRHSGYAIDHVGVSSVISACRNLKSLVNGVELHGFSLKNGLCVHVQVGNILIDMYAKCGAVDDARKMFDEMDIREQLTWNSMLSGYVQCSSIDDAVLFFSKMPEKNVVSFTTIITGSSQSDRNHEAIGFFHEMQKFGMVPDVVSFVSVLSACVQGLDFREGLKIHGMIIKSGLQANSVIGSVLVSLYAKCGFFDSAGIVVDRLDCVDDFSWSILISEYCKHGLIDSARELFENIAVKSLPLWNALIGGCCELALDDEALQAFKNMISEGIKGDEFTFGSLLTCVDVTQRRYGQQLHSQTLKAGVELSFSIVGALIDMYGRTHAYEDAARVFFAVPEPNLIVCNTMISCYVQANKNSEAINVMRMAMEIGTNPDNVTFSLILDSCAHLLSLNLGTQIHALACKFGLESDVVVGTALTDMYSKCDFLDETSRAFSEIYCHSVVSWTALLGCYVRFGMWAEVNDVFAKMPERNVVSWNTMFSGHVKQGNGLEVIHLYSQMCKSGLLPDQVSFVSLLTACTKCALHEPGKQIHVQIIKSAYYMNKNVSVAVNDFYQGIEKSRGDGYLLASEKMEACVVWRGTFRDGLAQE